MTTKFIDAVAEKINATIECNETRQFAADKALSAIMQTLTSDELSEGAEFAEKAYKACGIWQ
jgi:hypothetical protein